MLLVARPILIERGPGFLVNRLRALARLVARDPLALQRAAPDLRVEHLVRPVVIVKMGGEVVTGGDSGLVLESLPRLGGRERLLSCVEYRLSLDRSRVAARSPREPDGEADLA